MSALVAILSSSISVSKDNTGTEECLCRDNLFFVDQKLLQLLNGGMSWKENSFLLRLWPYQGVKHTVSQNSEFIARYCYANDNDIYASAPLLASLFATAKFLSLARERSERDTLRSVQLRIVYIILYIMVRAIFVLITRKEGGA